MRVKGELMIPDKESCYSLQVRSTTKNKKGAGLVVL